ncbi:hypothetical protein [Leisingera sp. S232]|uniref:hypothetical protein n=1 Tax=Leisingera sp. S232 TaxID=3415132 RepID=UPI003C7E4B0F
MNPPRKGEARPQNELRNNAKLTDAVDTLFGGACKSLNNINDVCDDVVEIVEPIRPILEGISAIT